MFFKKVYCRYVHNGKKALVSAGVNVSGKVLWEGFHKKNDQTGHYKRFGSGVLLSHVFEEGCVCVCVPLSVCLSFLWVCIPRVCGGYDVWGMGAWVYKYVLWNCGNSVTSSLLKGLDSSKGYLCFFVTSS